MGHDVSSVSRYTSRDTIVRISLARFGILAVTIMWSYYFRTHKGTNYLRFIKTVQEYCASLYSPFVDGKTPFDAICDEEPARKPFKGDDVVTLRRLLDAKWISGMAYKRLLGSQTQ